LAPRPFLLAPLAALALTACAGAFVGDELARAPAWFKERQKELAGQDYPRLGDVPGPAAAAADAPRWAQVERELKAEAAAIAASPRSAPAPAADAEAEAFDKAAREAIGATRPQETGRPQ
jgi:hypothetical protein